ncbi:MAG TPA: Holliday junction resolvase RuvX [Tepidisphaeraceae bacterium]|jgi:putative Holliday junction resolvase
MRTLAIDHGTRRIGLALSDEGGRWATPLEVLMVTDPAQALEPIAKLIVKEGVQRVVIGLPLNMDDGSISGQARLTIAWADKLSALTGIPTTYVDERLSSFEAEQQLIGLKRQGAKMTRKSKKKTLDAVAAAGFLQEFLDGKLPPITP